MKGEFLTNLATLCGVCIVGVNIIVEVLKSFWLKKETSRPVAVLLVSEAVSFFVMCMYCEIEHAVATPMMVSGVLVGGFFVAYGAMFGYDKLYGKLFDAVKNVFKNGGENND